MKNDFISREVLKKTIIDRYGHWSRDYKSLWDILDGVLCIIDTAPTINQDLEKID